MLRPVRLLMVLMVVGLSIAACDDSGLLARSRATPTQSTLPSVLVTLREFSILASPTSASAGKTTFQADNKGPNLQHQLVLAKTTLGAGDLPTKSNGAVDESKLDIVGRIVAFAPRTTTSTIFTLTTGSYVLFCNLVATSGTRKGAHYKLGMRAAFSVT